jgi:hypothetical protein
MEEPGAGFTKHSQSIEDEQTMRKKLRPECKIVKDEK